MLFARLPFDGIYIHHKTALRQQVIAQAVDAIATEHRQGNQFTQKLICQCPCIIRYIVLQ